MVDRTEDREDAEGRDELNTDYYDVPEEGAHERSAQNVSVPDRAQRDLWQSTNISTDGTGPTVDQVAPVFAQARADALANPVTADDDDERVANEQADSARAAQERADAIRESAGYVAPTGADAGVYDDAEDEDAVPAENFSRAPELDEDERDSDEVAREERVESGRASVAPVYTDEVDQRAPEREEAPAEETEDSEGRTDVTVDDRTDENSAEVN